MSRRKSLPRSPDKTLVISSSCRSLILLDATPIRREAQRKCQELIHQMDLARSRLRRFNEESQPAFQRWMNSTFGAEITELRELAQKLHNVQRIISEVEQYKFVHRCSYHLAYMAVLDRKSRPPSADSETEEQRSYFDEEGGPFSQSSDGDDDWNSARLRAMFESLLGPPHLWRGSKAEYEDLFENFKESFEDPFDDDGFEEDGEESVRRSSPVESDESSEEADKRDAKLKTLYRALARSLHPDVNVELDQKRKELWHQVQDAYDARDVETLETLSAMSAIFDDRAHSIDSVWSLKSLFEELRSGLQHLQKQIGACKREIAWGFEKTKKESKKIERLQEKIASQMRTEKTELLDYIGYCEGRVERWKTPPVKKRRKSTPKPLRAQRRPWTKEEMDSYTGFGRK